MPVILEKQRAFGVSHLGLDARDVGLNVPIGYKKVLEAVEVVIKEEKAKCQRKPTVLPDG